MRSLPAAILAEIVKAATFMAHFYKLSAASTYRWTDCDQDIYFYGNYWLRKKIVFDGFDLGMGVDVPSITVTIPNVDKAFSDMALGEDLRGKPFNIYRVMLEKPLTVIGRTTEASLDIVFPGLVDSISMDRKDARITVVSHMVRWRTLTPRRRFEPTCWKVFKGTECAYAGAETWCDKSKERCAALSNTDSFGGFEFCSEMSVEEVYWGKRVKSFGKK